jgi:hypothetical protein
LINRTRWPIAFIALVMLAGASSASASVDCRPTSNIGPGLKKLIQDFQTADKSGTAQFPVQDFLVGVTAIKQADQAALDHRGAVKASRTAPGQGAVHNTGQAWLEFDALFAGEQTYFKVPQAINSHYLSKPNSVVLFYDSGNALHLGESILGITLYHRVNHVAIFADKLLFFWDDNSSDEPDRCYVPS